VDDHVHLHGPWPDQRSALYAAPAVTVEVENIAAEAPDKWRRACTNLMRTDLVDLGPLFDVEGVRFYSLQYGAQEEVKQYPQIIDLGNVDDPSEKFVQSAAIVSCLDLVVCCDSSIGHLAGALGKPCRVLLALSHDPKW
jgi:Glycosyltransferase family 9 (heptosyltransferase)